MNAIRKLGAGTAKAQTGIIPILVVLYFLQVLTPLRLHPDTVVLLSVAESVARGNGFLYHGQTTVFPPGYPALLALLMKLNIAHVWVMVGISVAFLLLGLSAVCFILYPDFFSETRSALNVCIFSLLSFAVIKYSTIPLTDTCFFGVCMCSLAVMNSVASRVTWRKLLASATLVVISLCIRRIGVVLVPPLLWILFSRSEARLNIARLTARMKVAIILVVTSASIAFAWVIHATSTLRDFKEVFAGRALKPSVLGILHFRLTELGEITVNLPAQALPSVTHHLLPIVGAITSLLVCGGVFSRRKRFNTADIFFIGYVSILLVWPYCDTRFWLPVVPFLIAYAGLSFKCLMQFGFWKPIPEAYAVVFAIMGVLTLVSSTAISLSGSHFGDEYPEYHATYCAAGYCKAASGSLQIDEDGLHLLRTYK